MASVFRRRIASQIISSLKPFLVKNENGLIYDLLPLSMKFSQPKLLPPQFELSWKDVVKIKPDLKDRMHFTSVNTILSNQDFPTADGITQILTDSVNQEKLVFTIDQDVFSSSVLLDICYRLDKIPDYSCFFKSIVPENIIVEYSSPNVAKPFHFGHFRSTVVGNFIANICQYVGHKVTRINYVGDWGLQYGILAVGFNKFGSEDKLKEDPLHHLLEVYKLANEKNDSDETFNQEAREYFKKMEQGDKDALELWKRLCNLSLKEIAVTYGKLDVKFDEVERESMYYNQVDDIYNILLSKKLASLQDDSSIEYCITNEDSESKEKVVLRKSDGTSLYLTRDIVAAIERKKRYNFDRMYYVVDSGQRKHFNSLKRILEGMSHSWAEDLQHVPFGRILKFSTRKGSAIFLNDILDEAKERTLEKMNNSETTKVTENLEEVAEVLGISALLISDFRGRRKRDYPFDWEKVLSMKGDSGVSLQYCHARLNNIKENCGVTLYRDCEFQCLVEPEAIALIAHLSRFDEAVYQAYTDLEPCALVHYLFVLKNEVGRAIKELPVKGSSLYLARARLVLFHASHLVMRKSLQILGLKPLNKM